MQKLVNRSSLISTEYCIIIVYPPLTTCGYTITIFIEISGQYYGLGGVLLCSVVITEHLW